MKNKLFVFFVLTLFAISISLYYINQQDTKLFNLASAKAPSATLFTCNYNDITPMFRTHGMPLQSVIRDVHKIGPGHLSVLLSNLRNNRTEMYIYNLGNDLKLNTSDDTSYNLNSFFGGNALTDMRPMMVLDNGTTSNYTLYWVEHTSAAVKNIKSCRMTPNGCITITTRATFPQQNFRAFGPSTVQNRLYVVHNTKVVLPLYQYYYSTFRSCSMTPGASDSCTGNFSNYALYPNSNQYNVTYEYSNNIQEAGFVVKPNYPVNYTGPVVNDPDFTYFFNMDANNTGEVIPLPTMDPDTITPVGSDLLFAIRKDLLFANDTISLIHIPTATYTDIDALPESIDHGFFLESNLNGIFTLYRSSTEPITLGRAYGRSSTLIYNNTLPPEVVPKFIMNDSSVIGFIDNQLKVVRFMCSL